MNNTASKFSRPALTAVAMSLALVTSAFAHDDEGTVEQADSSEGLRVGPATLVQLDDARAATARYLDVDAAIEDGYVDVGAFVPHMGWHYVHFGRVDTDFDPERPEVLVYADDPCGGKRRLVAMEYAIPLELSSRAPTGFIGRADIWERDQALGLWTLHAWVWEYNPDGVFAAFNPRVP